MSMTICLSEKHSQMATIGLHIPTYSDGTSLGFYLRGVIPSSVDWQVREASLPTFGVISLLGMYVFVLSIWRNHTAALIATVLLGLDAAHLYSSRLVSYDIVSFTFFIWGIASLDGSVQKETNSFDMDRCLKLAIVCSNTDKYTAIVYLPFIAVLVLYQSPRQFLLGCFITVSVLVCYA